MIRTACMAALLAASFTLNADSNECVPAEWLPGTWSGTLAQVGLSLNFHFEQDGDGCFTGTFDSPDQGGMGLPLSKVEWDGEVLRAHAEDFGFRYTASRDGDTLDGEFFQGASLALTLTRAPAE